VLERRVVYGRSRERGRRRETESGWYTIRHAMWLVVSVVVFFEPASCVCACVCVCVYMGVGVGVGVCVCVCTCVCVHKPCSNLIQFSLFMRARVRTCVIYTQMRECL